MKLFEKKRDGCRRIYYFCGKKFLSYKKKLLKPLKHKTQNTKHKTQNTKHKTQNTKHKNPKVELSVVSILKNEAPYIVEWIEYHLLVGVSRFYLYDNESEDNVYELLKPYIDNGIVIYQYVEGKCMQIPVYNDAIFNYKNETEWMAIIDLDEYIVPISTNNINDILKKFSQYSGLGVNSIMFDSNGYVKKPDLLTTEAYTRRRKNLKSDNCVVY